MTHALYPRTFRTVGIPQEGVACSRGASGGASGGPQWKKAKFTIGECEAVYVNVEMWYS